MAPKPKSQDQKRRPNLDIAGRQGRSRYTKSTNFDSVQQLAQLGQIIPLVFAKQRGTEGNYTGGIRVETDLLHSQMVSNGSSQLLYALTSLGMTELGNKPTYEGLAIGDLLIRDFSPYKSRVYFNGNPGEDNRLTQNNLYNESKLWKADNAEDRFEDQSDVFAVRKAHNNSWQPFFSGARTPSTSTQFGCFKPLPNGHRFYLPFELVLVINKSGKTTKEASRTKRNKLELPWPRMCGITKETSKEVTYTVFNDNRDPAWWDAPGTEEFNVKEPKFKPFGIEDVVSIQDETKIIADENLQENQQYLIGGSLAMLIRRETSDIWEKGFDGNRKYIFKIEERFTQFPATPVATSDYQGASAEALLTSPDPANGGAFPWERATIQQAAVASITNSRPCDITEIGIKSEVWRRMNGSINFNSIPTWETIEEYEKDGANITVGGVNAYMRRYSFFRLYGRKLGGDTWHDLTSHSNIRAFAVLGSSPVSKYNTLQIEQPELGIYEYRFVPVCGAEFYKANRTSICLLDARGIVDTGCHKYQINISGIGTFKITITGVVAGINPDNSEWIVNTSDIPEDFGNTGGIETLDRYETDDTIPNVATPGKKETKYSRAKANEYTVIRTGGDRITDRTFLWNGSIIKNYTAIDDETIQTTENGKTFEYSPGVIKEEGADGYWKDTNGGNPQYDLGSNTNSSSSFQECVWQGSNGKWNYEWNGRTEIANISATDEWVVKPNSSYRYKRSGNLVKEQWLPVEDQTDKYKKRSGELKKGARRRKDSEIYDFYLDGKNVGSGTLSRPLIYKVSNLERWKVSSLIQADAYINDEKGYIEATPGIKQRYGVKWGVVLDGKRHRYWADGIEVANVDKSVGVVSVGDMTYQKVFTEALLVGERSDLPCWPIITYRHAESSITQEFKYNSIPTYAIMRSQYIDPEPEYSEIIRTRINLTPVQPTIKLDVPVRYTNEGEENATAKATVYYYPDADGGSGKITWNITEGGDDYKVNQEVRIGDKTMNPYDQTRKGPLTKITRLENSEFDDDRRLGYAKTLEPGTNYFPLNAICDYYINDTDTSSHADSPEHTLVFCNEIVKQSGNEVPKFENLTLLGLKLTNSKEWSSFNNFSAYIELGIKVKCLEQKNDPIKATNYFPNIAYALLTDSRLGAGDAIGPASVNKEAMTISAKFCEANGFYWDGVIADAENLREFIYENAGYILCDFTVIGGKFGLQPSLPYGSDYVIDTAGKPQIKALFTDGVVRKAEVSFLSPEERQPFQAVCLYREETKNGFAETRSLRMRFSDETDDLPIEEFDLTGFCTSVTHVRMFTRVALMLRRKVDHSIKFETTPQAAMSLNPGEYFKFASKVTHTERFASGVIDQSGNVISSERTTGTISIVYWEPGTTALKTAQLNISANYTTNQTALYGCLWSKVSDSENTRVYKCESLSYAEDGLVEVAGSYTPLTNSGSLAILDWNSNTFFEENS